MSWNWILSQNSQANTHAIWFHYNTIGYRRLNQKIKEVWRTKSKVGPYRILICLCSSIWHNSTLPSPRWVSPNFWTHLGLSFAEGPICPWLLWAFYNEPAKCLQPMLPPQNLNQPQVDAMGLTSCATPLLMGTKALNIPAASRSQAMIVNTYDDMNKHHNNSQW